jgi:hypothetical protein
MSRIQQHDVRIRGADRLQRAQAVGSFKHGSAAEVGQHSAREAPHVRIIVDHQDIQTLEHFFDLLVGHETPDRRQNCPAIYAGARFVR